MANFPIDETQKAVNQELRKIETSDPVHADVYNALLEQLINNDAFLERLAKEMIRQSMISHVLDSVNPNMVLGADVGPKITEITEALQQSITVLNTNFIHFDSDIRTCLNPLSSQYIAHASTSIVGKVSIFTWTADTVDTPYKTGDTAYENGFCLTYESGSGWFTQVAMAVGDSHLFTRHCRGGGWSGWTTIGAPVI